MRKFLLNCVCFISILLFIMAAIEIILLSKPNTYSYKYNYVEQHIDEISVLLLGNSHIEEAVDPKLVGKDVFNLAMSARYLKYDIELAKKFIPRLSHLKIVIMPLDYDSFILGRAINNGDNHNNGQKKIEQSMKCMYYKYMGIRVDPFWNWSEFLCSNEDFIQRLFYKEGEGIECDSLGFFGLDVNNRNRNWQYKALPPLIDETKQKNISLYNVLYSYYRVLADLTQKKGAKLILISTPVYKTYHQCESQKILDERKQFVEKLQDEYSCVSYYDFSKLECLDDDDYNDAGHLTKTGAIKFSSLLHSIVNK